MVQRIANRWSPVASPHFPPEEGTSIALGTTIISRSRICPLWPQTVPAPYTHGAVRGSAGMAPPGERMLSVDAGVP